MAMIDQMVEVLLWTAMAALIYAQLGYPALMALFARRRPTAALADDELPTVSLIIPAHNEALVLRAKLENSLKIEYPKQKLEILVASDGSVDETVSIAGEFSGSGVRVLPFEQRRGKASVVNDAVAASSGEVVCLCDANVMFRPDALRLLVAHLEDPKVGAASGDVRLASDESDFGAGESLYYRVERAIQLGESRVGSMMGVDGGMFVMRRDLFRPLPPDTILDDFLSSMNVILQHRRIVYEPDAVATENGTPTWRQEFRRRVRVTAGAVQCLKRGQFPPLSRPIELWQFLSHKLLRWLGPVWVLLIAVSALIAFPRVAALAGLAIALPALCACLVPPLRRSKLGTVLFYYVISHVAVAAGLLKGLLMKQSGVWERTERKAQQQSGPSTADGLQPDGEEPPLTHSPDRGDFGSTGPSPYAVNSHRT